MLSDRTFVYLPASDFPKGAPRPKYRYVLLDEDGGVEASTGTHSTLVIFNDRVANGLSSGVIDMGPGFGPDLNGI